MRLHELCICASILLNGCVIEGPVGERDGGRRDAPGTDGGVCIPDRCDGTTLLTCEADGSERRLDCAADGLTCAPGLGCVVCYPGSAICDGNTAAHCRTDGSGYDETACDGEAGEVCADGACVDGCERAATIRSSVGCEFWPTVTANPTLAPTTGASPFAFAVLVSNPHDAIARVTITRGDTTVVAADVAPEATSTFELPWVEPLRAPAAHSVRVDDGGYRLTASIPVSVQQFSPLTYERCEGTSCSFSYSNDASLLMPVTSWDVHHLVTTWAPNGLRVGGTAIYGAFVTITAARASRVRVAFASRTASSVDGAVAAHGPGDEEIFVLDAGDVLQLRSEDFECVPTSTDATYSFCRADDTYDLSGTAVDVLEGSAQVIAGHECAFVPYNRMACDHLEEVSFPVEYWGSRYLVAPLTAYDAEHVDYPNVVRITAQREGTVVTLDPPIEAQRTLAAGETMEVRVPLPVAITALDAAGDPAPIAVAQHMVAAAFEGLTAGAASSGDPAMTAAIPVEQFRERYEVLIPDTYVSNVLTLIVLRDTTVEIDGSQVTAPRAPIGASAYDAVTVEVTPGAHTITSEAPSSVQVFGLAPYTSYAYPGGVELEVINPVL